jgi:hypothetical protein
MDYTKLFYWLVVADNARTMFTTFVVIFTIIGAISTIWFIVDRNGYDLSVDDNKGAERAKKWMWWSYPFMIFFWSLFVFTPSKKDALLIVAGGQTLNFLTTDESAKQIPSELSGFILTELKNMAAEAQVELGIKDQKQKILDEAKNMTREEIIERIKTDDVFAKLYLEDK